MHKFEKLEVWQLAVEYVDLCYVIAEQLPRQEDFNLASQLRRAAVSIALNIAEGSTGQTDPEQARFIGMAIRSLVETVACQHLIRHRGYACSPVLLDNVYQASEKLNAKLYALRRSMGGQVKEERVEYMIDDVGPENKPTTVSQGPSATNHRQSSIVDGQPYFVHPSAYVDEPCEIGAGTRIWHFCHVTKGAVIGERCNLGQNVFVGATARIGSNVKIQNNVSVYDAVDLEDDVFCGPSCVFTNVINPRSQIVRHSQYLRTVVRRGATIGANATIVCGATVGRYAFIAAGAVVRGDVPDYALMIGVPARRRGWMSRHGYRLANPDADGVMLCPESGWRYREIEPGVLRCLDWPEDEPLAVTSPA